MPRAMPTRRSFRSSGPTTARKTSRRRNNAGFFPPAPLRCGRHRLTWSAPDTRISEVLLMRRTLFAIVLLALPLPLAAQGFKMEPPKSPADSLKCIKARPGFKAELMVAEPLVMDPIAFAWGPDGKFWVVEMGDYPLGIDGKGK